MDRAVGLDFGTTNTALAVLDDGGAARLATFDNGGDGPVRTFRSVLHFTPVTSGPPQVVAGPAAIQAYLAGAADGRLVQSLKSYLASRQFTSTNVFGRRWRLEELLGVLLRRVREAAEAELGPLGRRVVAGRPVRFVDSPDEETDRFAEERLRAAIVKAGFDEVRFVYEPVAAAVEYRSRLAAAELALIADFGGGTTDLCLVHLEPGGHASAGHRIVAVGGVGIAGDCFDGRLIHRVVAPALGQGVVYRSSLGRELPVPAWLYTHLRRWHHVSFLKGKRTLDILDDIIRSAAAPGPLEGLRYLIDHDLGFGLHRAVQHTKFALSDGEQAPFRFADGPMDIAETVARADFEAWIAPDLDAIAAAVDEVLAAGEVRPGEVGAVFLTGGSSFVPAVRRLFASRFGAERLRGGRELTTVASGLAMAAAEG